MDLQFDKEVLHKSMLFILTGGAIWLQNYLQICRNTLRISSGSQFAINQELFLTLTIRNSESGENVTPKTQMESSSFRRMALTVISISSLNLKEPDTGNHCWHLRVFTSVLWIR